MLKIVANSNAMLASRKFGSRRYGERAEKANGSLDLPCCKRPQYCTENTCGHSGWVRQTRRARMRSNLAAQALQSLLSVELVQFEQCDGELLNGLFLEVRVIRIQRQLGHAQVHEFMNDGEFGVFDDL